MNSLLQTMFILKQFRSEIFQMDTREHDSRSIPLCLQRIFYNLQEGPIDEPVRTIEFMTSLGLNKADINIQQDPTEF